MLQIVTREKARKESMDRDKAVDLTLSAGCSAMRESKASSDGVTIKSSCLSK